MPCVLTVSRRERFALDGLCQPDWTHPKRKCGGGLAKLLLGKEVAERVNGSLALETREPGVKVERADCSSWTDQFSVHLTVTEQS